MNSYSAERIRNVGLFSHGGDGKTTLAEGMLFVAGNTKRLGKVLDGTTVSDYDPDEIKRKSSVSSTLLPIEYQDHKINVLDTPGYSEFIGEMLSAMRVVDLAVILVDAHTSIEVGSLQMWKAACAAGVPRMIVVNKMDRENANFDNVFAEMRERWGHCMVPLTIPIGSEHNFRGVVNILDNIASIQKEPGSAQFETTEQIPVELQVDVQRYQEMLMELAAEADDELTDKYLEDGVLADGDLRMGIREGVVNGTLVPVLAASGATLAGLDQLLKEIIELGPSPLERPANSDLKVDAGEPGAALVFKTLADPFVGKLSYFRVYSGTLRTDSHLTNTRTGGDERLGQLFFVRGKEQKPADRVEAGDIGAVAKLGETLTGDTLADPSRLVTLEPAQLPSPGYTAAIRPRTKSDLDKMGVALHRMTEEDPTIHVGRDATSGETLVSGMGESHIHLLVERLQRKFSVNVETALPTVPYRETITVPATSEYKHKKQTGGHGQYGHVVLQLQPDPEHEFEFGEKVVGGAVPKNYFPAVEKGVQEATLQGPVAGYPVVNVKVTLTDGSYHPVDSSEMAFKVAASHAFRKGASEAHPTLLEPIMGIVVTVPDEYVGDAMSDLTGKRARVEGMEPQQDGTTLIRAQVPLAEVQRYASDLRAMTQGNGSFSMEFSHYEEVPAHLISRIVESAKAPHEEVAAH